MKTPILIAGALLLATPALAQMPPPPPPGAGPDAPPPPEGRRGGYRRMFASLSPAGQTTMMTAMRAADPKADREPMRAARDRMLGVLEADKLDTGALKRAMADERELANASRERHQAAMLAGFQQLSAADRKAFVVEAREMQGRMESRMREWRGRRGGRDGAMPPPPPPQ